MVEKIKFQSNLMESAEKEYNLIRANVEQNQIALNFATIINKYIPMPERAFKGFFWRAVKRFQVKNQVTAADTKTRTPAERIKGLEEIFTLLKEELTRTLVDQAHEPLLNEALDKAMNVYKEKYANR